MFLADIRGCIDMVDEQLIKLFCERMRLVAAAGEAKYRLGLPLSDDAREQEISVRSARLAGKELAPYARQFCQALFKIFKEYQVHQLAMYRRPEAADEQRKS
jgi:chorismate mutase